MSGKPALKPIARRLRRQQTDAERKLWRFLRNRQCGGYKFRRQVEIGRYIADFVCLEEKLIVELDGGQHLEQQQADHARSKEFEIRGYRVIRFWNHEALLETGAVLEAIRQALMTPSSPSLLPEREGGQAP